MSAEREFGPRASTRAVTVTSRSLWRLRLTQSLPRYLYCAAACAGLIASARFAVFPPQGRAVASSVRPSPSVADRGAEGYAVLFARRYLSWDAAEPQTSDRPLGEMGGSAMALDAGLILPATGAQHVAWAEVVQEREPRLGAHVYTVAAQTDGAGLVYLAVGVTRMPDGSLGLSGYPAFVGAPAERGAQLPSHVPTVDDAGLAVVVRRALRNYLAASPDELDADLARGANVTVPGIALTLEAMQSLGWSDGRHSVLAVVQARDVRGMRYTLAYELDVVDVNGRWEISAVEMDPDR